jgi:hypothetical protein
MKAILIFSFPFVSARHDYRLIRSIVSEEGSFLLLLLIIWEILAESNTSITRHTAHHGGNDGIMAADLCRRFEYHRMK